MLPQHPHKLLRSRRLALGWTALEVALKARAHAPGLKGFHQTSILGWESGADHRSPTTDQLLAWAAVLGVKVEFQLPDAA